MYSIKELCDKYDLSYGSLKWGCSQGKYPSAIQKTEKGKEKWYLGDADVVTLLEENHFIKNSYSSSDLQKVLDCSGTHIKTLLKSTFKGCFKIINNKTYINKDIVDNYIKSISFEEESVDIESACKLTSISKSLMFKYIKKGYIRRLGEVKGLLYLPLNDINHYVNIKEAYLDSAEIAQLLNINVATISIKCARGDFKTSIKNPYAPSTWIVTKKEIETILAEYIDPKTMTNNVYEYFDILTKSMDLSLYPTTVSIYKMYINNKLRKSNAKDLNGLTRKIIKAFKDIYDILNKELYTYSDIEVKSLMESEYLGSEDVNILTDLLNYQKNRKCVKCTYTEKYVFKPKDKKSDEAEDNIYSREIWGDYYKHLTDIDLHIKRALDDQKYACTWLYLQLHLFLSWRRNDFLKLPNINLDVVGINSFDWLYENTFTLSIGEAIVNELRMLSESIYTDKTDVRAHFVVTMDAIIPIAMAYTVAELHRRENNHKSIMEIFNNTKPKKDRHILWVYEDRPDLQDFSSLKCNRTLLTYGYENAVKTKGFAYLSYELAQYMRSHKKDKNIGLSEMTKKYIYSTNNDGSIDDVTFNLFRRGYWGWLYRDLIYICLNQQDSMALDMKDETDIIEQMESIYSPLEVDRLSLQISNNLNERKSIIKELLELEPSEIKEFLIKIINKESPAKMKNAQCLRISSCVYPNAKTCIGCKYLIPEQYLLYELKDEINKALDKLDNMDEHQFNERIKVTYFIEKMLYLLQDAKSEYDKYDDNYINSIFDLDKMFGRISNLAQNKFLHVEDI